MKFELKDYHSNVSDQKLLQDVQDVAQRLSKDTLTGREYSLNGKYHHGTLQKRFGSWKKVLELCNLKIRGHNFKYKFSDEDVISDLKRVGEIIDKTTLSHHEYSAYGEYHASTLISRYGSWNKVLELAGMKLNLQRNFSNEEMFEEIERVWTILGRQPTTTDIKNGISKYSLNSYARRFGGWRKALEAFVDFINSGAEVLTEDKCVEPNTPKDVCNDSKKNAMHKTSRDINLRLRFRVLQRDNFKCCACGASPAKAPAVELHVDHILPWSKGGETVFENLQTLCSKCNFGKSDM